MAPDTAKAPTARDGGALDFRSGVSALNEIYNIWPARDRQAKAICRRVRVSPAVAAMIASHAFGEVFK